MRTTQRPFAIAAVAGVVLALASPPLDVLPGLWLGMAGLAASLEGDTGLPAFASRARVALTGARRGILFGAAANVVALRFIPSTVASFTPLPWAAGLVGLLLLAAFEGLRWGLAAVACETLVRARVPRPLAFAAGVYAGTFLPTMIPWTVAGGATPWPAMVQLADVFGERGVAAIMALVAGLLASGARLVLARRTRRRGVLHGALAAVTLLAQAGLGAWRMNLIDAARDAAPHTRVALLQPGVPASTRWEPEHAPGILASLTQLTATAEARGAKLVVWPEAAYPYPLEHGARSEPASAPPVLGAGVHGPVLTGVLLEGPGDATYNAAVVATRDGLSPSYDKRHLLWFGETVPLADRLPWLRHVFARGLGLTAGTRTVLLDAPPVHAEVLVCYEDTLPDAGRDAIDLGPNLLVNVTNDAWFAAPESALHLRLAALRAVELRRDLVRAVNGGIPSWFDATGRLRARGSAEFAGITMAEPALLATPATPFARFGDAPWALAALLAANAAVWRAARRRS